MKLHIPFISALCISTGAIATGFQKRWINQDKPLTHAMPGVTDDCKYWASNVTEGDTCSSLMSYFDITFTELLAWNTGLFQEYCELLEGYSYCVEGPAVPANESTATAVDAADSTKEPHMTWDEVDDDELPSNSTGASNMADTTNATISTNTTDSATGSDGAGLADAETPSPTSAAPGLWISLICLVVPLSIASGLFL
ncbi:hypothetical protein BJX99DRAFT_233144 [Aspergillus californicus]